jgi:CRISPR-associated endonuclease Cas1
MAVAKRLCPETAPGTGEPGSLCLDPDGKVRASFGPPGTDRPALRRAQATASQDDSALALSKWLVDAKLRAQQATLGRFADRVDTSNAGAVVESYRRLAIDAQSPEELRQSEAWAAGAYWQALAPLEVRFARRDVERVPNHWRSFGSRSSPLANGPRLAGNPANAVLNYLYALLEAEATLAARIVGLDPGMGLMHADQPFRDSLSADLMEPIRPLVDAYAFELLTSRPFATRDFFETRQGACRVTAPVTHELAQTCRRWGQHVGRVAEDLAAWLEPRGTNRRGSPTPVSGRRRAASWLTKRDPHRTTRILTRVTACSWCGVPVSGTRRTCSPECRSNVVNEANERFRSASSARMRQMAKEPNHPALSTTANERRRQTRRSQRAAELAWEKANPGLRDQSEYRTDVLPLLSALSTGALARLTGLSMSYCAAIKRGDRVPHPRWWQLLRELAPDRPSALVSPPISDPARNGTLATHEADVER